MLACALVHAGEPHDYRQIEPEKPKVIECDVLVYGGMSAGVTAAIQVGDMGYKCPKPYPVAYRSIVPKKLLHTTA